MTAQTQTIADIDTELARLHELRKRIAGSGVVVKKRKAKTVDSIRADIDTELAISIRQPYVEQILLGVKKYEFRSTLTNIRGRVYLYAAKTPVDSAIEWRKARSEPGKLPTGVIVGSVEITDCEWNDDRQCFQYKLEAPKRIRKYLVPNAHPQPKFFKPRV